MASHERRDPYTELVTLGLQDFELRGDIAVPLHFNPDSAFILNAAVSSDDPFMKKNITELPQFHEICKGPEEQIASQRFAALFFSVRSVFDALGSRVIIRRQDLGAFFYQRNPEYTFTDLSK